MDRTILRITVDTPNSTRRIHLKSNGKFHTMHTTQEDLGMATIKSSNVTDIFRHLNKELALIETEAATRLALNGHKSLGKQIVEMLGVSKPTTSEGFDTQRAVE